MLFFLIIAIIVIGVMAFFIYKFNDDKTTQQTKSMEDTIKETFIKKSLFIVKKHGNI
ncbi:MAG: hypothetical protein IKF97_03515 [Clostridia bacterium]|nr:hypothetical protein [Clostridia bacterium]